MMEPMVQLARVLPIVLHPAVIVCATEKLSLKKKKKKWLLTNGSGLETELQNPLG